jgi:hypothetical protein
VNCFCQADIAIIFELHLKHFDCLQNVHITVVLRKEEIQDCLVGKESIVVPVLVHLGLLRLTIVEFQKFL